MQDIILKKFTEWTAGLEPREARISIYNHIRDIPYAIIPELRDPATGPAGLLEQNKGSCIPKHFLLGIMFEKLGIPVKYATSLYSWDDPRVKYPPDLKMLVKRLPAGAHLTCKAYIEGRWILIDATWDRPLKKAGFPVNETWDGISPTKNAVKAVQEIIHDSVEDRVRFASEQKKSWTKDQLQAHEQFPASLNAWLESCRKKTSSETRRKEKP